MTGPRLSSNGEQDQLRSDLRTQLPEPGCFPPLVAVESVRTLPMNRAVFRRAKIVYVFEGRARAETALGTRELKAGSAFVLGSGTWCSIHPIRSVHLWTLYVDEFFLRMQMSWLLPRRDRVQPGLHPREWDGSPLVLRPGTDTLRRMEPLFRKISVAGDGRLPAELSAARTITLFLRAVELSLPTVLQVTVPADTESIADWFPVRGSLTTPVAIGHAGQAASILRVHMAERWTVERLATSVAVSRAHLTRLFTTQMGVAPMRYLTEVRLTEFTRLIEETDLSISAAARSVGWFDSRVAAAWFRRRFGMSPSEFRFRPHRVCSAVTS